MANILEANISQTNKVGKFLKDVPIIKYNDSTSFSDFRIQMRAATSNLKDSETSMLDSGRHVPPRAAIRLSTLLGDLWLDKTATGKTCQGLLDLQG